MGEGWQPIDARDEQGRVFTYLPEGELGSGAQSRIVLLARRTQVQAGDTPEVLGKVALKLAETGAHKERLEIEANILRRLVERGRPRSRIVRIGAEGQILRRLGADDLLIELEYLDGQTLAAYAKAHALSADAGEPTAADRRAALERAVRICRQLAEALHELSEVDSGIVHRDIKPQNVMLTSVGVRLFDFNVAKDKEAIGTTFVGSGQYMAPEVMLGHDYDQRADLFSLGVVFYELIARTPFERRLIDGELAGEFQVPLDEALLRDLPAELMSAVRALWDKLLCNQGRRFDSAGETVEAFAGIEQLLGIEAAASAPTSFAEVVPNVDPIQLLLELRPGGVHSVVANDDPETRAPLERFMRRRLHVPDPLDDWLAERVCSAARSGQRTLVVLAGNAGDGKSHLIQRLIRDHLDQSPELRERIDVVADATHADRPDQSQQDKLEGFFAPFANPPAETDTPVSVIAMNTGMVIRFFEQAANRRQAGQGVGDLSKLEQALRFRLGLSRHPAPELDFDLEVVNLDLRDVLADRPSTGSFFEHMLDLLDPHGEDTLLSEAMRQCEGCEARQLCPVRFNVKALQTERVRRAVISLLRRAALDPELHLSPRLLWSFVYRVTTGGENRYRRLDGDRGPCDVVRRRVEDASWLLDGHLSEQLFSGDKPDRPLWRALRELDPAHSPAPALDRLHTRFSVQKYRDDSDAEIELLGGREGRLEGLNVRQLLADLEGLERRRNAAVRRRVLFDPSSLEASTRWGSQGDYLALLEAYGAYSRGGAKELSADQRASMQRLTTTIREVFLRGAGKQIHGRRFVRMSQPHAASTSRLYVEVSEAALEPHFSSRMIATDVHIGAHRGREALLRHLGYQPRFVLLRIAGHRLVVDLELYGFLRQVEHGRQPSQRDLAQFEALLFVGEHIGNLIARDGPATMPLYIHDEEGGKLHRLQRDDFGGLTIAAERVEGH